MEIPNEARVENARQGDLVYVAHTFVHLSALNDRIEEAVQSGLDENMQAFVVANTLRQRMECVFRLSQWVLCACVRVCVCLSVCVSVSVSVPVCVRAPAFA